MAEFKIAPDDIWMRVRLAAWVRQRRDSSDVDIFLIDILRNGKGEHYYLTGTHGRLARVVFLDARSKVHEVADAAKRFETEKESWMVWRIEVLKASGVPGD